MTAPRYHLFERVGIELEYMLVDRDSLNVLPRVDTWFETLSGQAGISDFDIDAYTWSNELVRHVAELKVTQPVASFAGLASSLAGQVQDASRHLDSLHARLMPTAMHPWMDPVTETRLWPHESAEIYDMFHRLFDCHRHGWANLQSVHINLPFYDDEEFARLHAAIRMILPILPALAAASPFRDGQRAGPLDGRLDVYVKNAKRIPSISGIIIPEPVWSQADYTTTILDPMYRDIAPLDPEGVLQHEFLNARGAIARFDRNAIEIRLIDIQECPTMDVAIAEAVVHAIKKLADRHRHLTDWPAARLRSFLDRCIETAEDTLLEDTGYLRSFGVATASPMTARDLWRYLLDDLEPQDAGTAKALDLIATRGTLARRMLQALPTPPDRETLTTLYRSLCNCLDANQTFCP